VLKLHLTWRATAYKDWFSNNYVLGKTYNGHTMLFGKYADILHCWIGVNVSISIYTTRCDGF
jgi:hypothetical protein